ncbi:lycopene cyclase domain-containing protein [Microbacterium marmarense]|uniref:Lycopene cyclase domain-containing protein n=1 Tax=Microbacterium marmarense TaxID=3122051 RepID=A0ABU8LUB8_9MICO
MTYPLIIVPFAVITIMVTLLSAIRPNFRKRMLASAVAAAFICVLTAIFDNLMIASDLVVYPAQHLSGIFIGLAPIEDFSYSVCAAFLVPAVFVLLRRSPAERMPE